MTVAQMRTPWQLYWLAALPTLAVSTAMKTRLILVTSGGQTTRNAYERKGKHSFHFTAKFVRPGYGPKNRAKTKARARWAEYLLAAYRTPPLWQFAIVCHQPTTDQTWCWNCALKMSFAGATLSYAFGHFIHRELVQQLSIAGPVAAASQRPRPPWQAPIAFHQ